MVKHTQTISRQQPTNYLSVFDRFVGLALKALVGLALKPISAQCCIPYRNQSLGLHNKSNDWFYMKSNIGLKWVKYNQ